MRCVSTEHSRRVLPEMQSKSLSLKFLGEVKETIGYCKHTSYTNRGEA